MGTYWPLFYATPPYLLVGHSFGGINVRLFASTYPELVAGVILIDSCHEDQNNKMVPLFSKEVQDDYFKGFEFECSLIEFEESLEQVRNEKSLGNVPLYVITGGTQPIHTTGSWAYWMEFQKDLIYLSTNSKHFIVEDAGHAIHKDRPDHVVQLIRNMFESVCS